MNSAASPPRAGYRVYIDFDNTVTRGDVLDGLIERFAVGDRWRELETDWASGRISARTCLEGQLLTLRGTWPEFRAHLDTVEVDPGFAVLRDLLREMRVDFTIVSDNFDLFIAAILRTCGFPDVPFHANHVEFSSGRVQPSFPYLNPACPDCAHCKKIHFEPRRGDHRHVVYIGDGRSDLCPSRHADMVFAKASLLAHLQKEKIPCLAFDGLTEVASRLHQILHENDH